MEELVVIGIYATFGDCEDVRARLRYEGVPDGDIVLRVLKRIEAKQPQPSPDDKFPDIVFGTERAHRYAALIRNGESAVCVRAHSGEEAEIAMNTMRQFAPLDLELVNLEEEAAALRQAEAIDTSGRGLI